jgi:hypothetical protein
MRRTNSTLIYAMVTVAVLACAPRGGRGRMSQGERLGDEAVELLDDAEKALNELDADTAERKLREADRILKDPVASTNPDWVLVVERYKTLEPRVEETRTEKARQQIADRVEKRREVISKSLKVFRIATVDLEKNPTDQATIDAVRRAADQVSADIEWQRELQDKNAEFKSYVAALRIDVQNAHKRLAIAERASDFAQGPARDHEEALALSALAIKEKQLDARLGQLQEARDRYRRCTKGAASLIRANPGLEKMIIPVSGRRSTAGSIANACEARSTALEKQIASTQALEKKKLAKKSRKQKRASR